jgi:hypothetical protein
MVPLNLDKRSNTDSGGKGAGSAAIKTQPRREAKTGLRSGSGLNMRVTGVARTVIALAPEQLHISTSMVGQAATMILQLDPGIRARINIHHTVRYTDPSVTRFMDFWTACASYARRTE